MKKLLAMLLTALLVLSMGVVAMADEVPAKGPYDDMIGLDATVETNTITVTKNYTITGTNAVNPADTLQFTVTDSDFENDGTKAPDPIPAVSIGNVSVAQGATSAPITVSLPAYTVPGVYTYTIQETDTNKAGVTYLDDELTLKVTIVNGEEPGDFLIGGIALKNGTEKIDEFENKYDAGSLTVGKIVTGSMGDKTKVFNITVTLTAQGGDTVNAPITINASSGYTSFKEGETEVPSTGIAAGWTGTKTFTLQVKDGQSIILDNIPYGVTYTVNEADYTGEGYDEPIGEVKEATAISAATTNVTITNNKDIEIDTGIILQYAPYIAILAVVLAGAALLIIRRRRNNED